MGSKDSKDLSASVGCSRLAIWKKCETEPFSEGLSDFRKGVRGIPVFGRGH